MLTTAKRRSTDDFAVDGNLSKQAWKQAKWIEFDHDPTGKNRNIRCVQHVAAAVWTDRYIYFAFWAHYDSLNIYEGEDIAKERWELWNRDVVEVFLNPQPGKNFSLLRIRSGAEQPMDRSGNREEEDSV